MLVSKSSSSLQNSEAALTTLNSIHEAGILHGDIRPANILVSNCGITIIDFSHSFRSDDKVTKQKEYKRLRRLLRPPQLSGSA